MPYGRKQRDLKIIVFSFLLFFKEVHLKYKIRKIQKKKVEAGKVRNFPKSNLVLKFGIFFFVIQREQNLELALKVNL